MIRAWVISDLWSLWTVLQSTLSYMPSGTDPWFRCLHDLSETWICPGICTGIAATRVCFSSTETTELFFPCRAGSPVSLSPWPHWVLPLILCFQAVGMYYLAVISISVFSMFMNIEHLLTCSLDMCLTPCEVPFWIFCSFCSFFCSSSKNPYNNHKLWELMSYTSSVDRWVSQM